jgi:aminoglycoside phosphotransferase (APT) family kinase protein
MRRRSSEKRIVVAGPTRPDADVTLGLGRWLRKVRPDLGSSVTSLARPETGWSNETLLITTDAGRFVVRLPALVPAYPDYDLAAQSDVLRLLHDNNIPVARPLAMETDLRWLGSPFLTMEWVDGRSLAEVPALDPVLLAATPTQRRDIHEQYVDALAAVHRVDVVRSGLGLRRGLPDELAYWATYLDWSTSGAPPKRLIDALTWCARSMPGESAANVLLWGDPRLGNAMYDDGRLVALLDWELASVGPPEMDLAWYVALGELTASFMGADPDGLLGTDEFLDRHARAIGHSPDSFGWHVVFALVRSTAISDCMARLAHAHGLRYPGIAGDDNPLLDVIWQRIGALGG